MVKLAIFDVDFTLTKRETLIELYRFMLKRNPKLIKYLPRNIYSGLMYAMKVYSADRSKECFLKFIEDIHEKEMKELVRDFYETRLSRILYKDAIDAIKKHKEEGCLIYLISASPEFYLNELYAIKEVDKIIGTRVTNEKGYYKKRIQGINCKGEEKVKRLKEVLANENLEVDFENSYMYSDSLSDLPLFNIVGHPYLINYKKGHDKIEILNWK